MKHFNHNGKLYAEGTPVITASSRGLRYGDGLFETIKYDNGQLLLADEHFARLWNGMQVLQLQVPKHFTPEKLEEEIVTLAKKNGHDKKARIRITVYRGDGGLYDAANHFPNYIIEAGELPESDTLNSNGLALGIYTDVKKGIDILSNLKHNNYLPYVMAALHAKENKWNDAIVLNTERRICDTTIANIFIIKDEVIYTPALTEGCVAGVMRNHLIRQLPALNFKVIEKQISIEELMDADEVFLSNSIYTIRWVQSIADKTYGNSLTQKIRSAITSTIS